MEIETRVLVRSSSVKTEYIPQYKDSGFFGLFRSWRDMEDAFMDDNDAYYAWNSSGEAKISRTKQTAELACETYQAMKKVKARKKKQDKMHIETATETSYKHP